MPIPVWLAGLAIRSGMKEGIKEAIPPLKRELSIKPLNEGEDQILKELQDPNSPMVKNVSEWDNGDLARAFDSPSYDYNTYLQNKVEEYIRTKW